MNRTTQKRDMLVIVSRSLLLMKDSTEHRYDGSAVPIDAYAYYATL